MRKNLLNFKLALFIVSFAMAVCFIPSACADGGARVSIDGAKWRVTPQASIMDTGEQISTAGYDTTSWVAAEVPGTVFGSYVNDGLEADPTYADNIYKVDKTKYDRNFWYRTDFVKPASFKSGIIWLNFDGVNRDADIYVNGTNIGSLRGFFQRGRFDVTALLHPGTNSLAVLDYLPDLGKAEHGGQNYGSPEIICARGWDWMPYVPGLDMGIYKDVFFTNTQQVSLIDPWIRTDMLEAHKASLTVQAGLLNRSTSPVTGQLIGDIEPGHIQFSQTETLPAGQTTIVSLTDASTPELDVQNPKLWWPNGYGDPNLYTCHLVFKSSGVVSDVKDMTFGIRKYSYNTYNDTLHFFINGVRVFPKGGSWGMAEFMLRCNAKDYDTKVRFHRDLNFNMIRNWMGSTPDDAFYAACDKYGIMVWDEFWLNSSGYNPTVKDPVVFNANAIEKIKMFRNHPCIALWCGDNEGYPAPPLSDDLRSDVSIYDGNDRPFQPNSHAGNLSGSGPWNLKSLKQYFTGVQGFGGNSAQFGTRSEIGIATVPSYDSLIKFIPKADLWPQDDMWNKHFFIGTAGNAYPQDYDAAINHQFGPSANAQEFCEKAQLVNLQTMKAMFEGWLDHSDNDSAAILIWMSQSAFPSLVWQTYDYYYDTNGSYWGAKTACEPVHIYWNENDDRIRVVNTSGRDMNDLTAEACIYNMDGTKKYDRTVKVNSSAIRLATCFTLQYPSGLSAVHFIKLRLTNSSGQVISNNFYWRGNKYLEFKALDTIPHVNLKVVENKPVVTGDSETISVDVTNPATSKVVAVAIRPKLVNAATGLQILPVFMNDGYFSLVPGETKHVTINFDKSLVAGVKTKLIVECWNNQDRPVPSGPLNDIAYERPVTVSSTSDDSMDPEDMVDGDLNTRWSSAWQVDPQWVTIDLGKTQQIGHVRLVWERAFAKSYDIKVSNDQSNWTTIYHTDAGAGGTEDISNLQGAGRYIRLNCTARANPRFGYSLYEIEVYTPSAPSPVSVPVAGV